MRVAYLVSQYPKVSHTFIRREIQALERQGFVVQRLAVRGWDGPLVDQQDLQERARTRYLLQGGAWPLVLALLRCALLRPVRFARALALALRMAVRADRSLPYHLIYLAQACLMVPWLRAFGALHCHAHFGSNATEVVMLAQVLGGPAYSFTVHGPEEYDKPLFIGLPEKIRRAAFVVAITAFGRGQLWRWAALADWPKVQVVHCGVDPAFHAETNGCDGDARANGNGDDSNAATLVPRLVCVGRLCPEKGQLLLIDAVATLARQGVALHLTLCGDGDMRPEIDAAIARLHLQERIVVTGWIDGAAIRTHILAARALVLPSFSEGLPVAIMEAMALGRPVISTYIAGIPELVVDGDTGWLIPSGDAGALVDAMARCLNASAPQLDTMGASARQRVLARHAIDVEAAKLAALFRSHAKQPKALTQPARSRLQPPCL